MNHWYHYFADVLTMFLDLDRGYILAVYERVRELSKTCCYLIHPFCWWYLLWAHWLFPAYLNKSVYCTKTSVMGICLARNRGTQTDRDTCQVLEAELSKAEVSISSVVEKDGQGVASFIQFSASDDSQVLQRKIVELIQSHQHVTRHFTDGLRG